MALSNQRLFDICETMKSGTSEKSGRRLLVQFFGCLLAGSLLTGCAWTRTPVEMSLAPKVNQPVKQPEKATLTVAPVKDTRPVKDGLVLMQKQNEYGNTTGAYVTTNPVAEIFGDGLEATLKQNGFESANGMPYVLESTIQGFDYQTIAGFWQATFIPKVTVRFELVNQTNQLPVWHDTFIGQDRAQTPIGTGQFVADSFSRACDDVIQQLVSDPEFRSYFEP